LRERYGWRCARRAAAVATAAAALAGCGPREQEEPPGAWWAGRAEVASALLGQLAQLEGTPLARVAHEIAGRLPDCDRIGAHAPEGDLARLVEGVRCLEPADPLEQLRAREDADLVFALPNEWGGPVRGALHGEPDHLALDLRWQDPPRDGALGLLVPGREPVGPDRLAATGRLIHVRLRPRGGIDLASLIPAGSQADRLFQLRSGLFASTVLDGTWEIAAYLPETAGGAPGVALALGFRVKSAAVAATEGFLADLERTWPVRRSPLTLPSGDGACLLDLNVLPELAPCYVATRDALVLGWNRTSLERALGGALAAAPEAAGRLDVDLALIGRADTLLARHFSASEMPVHWPWTRLLAAGSVRGDDLELHLTLVEGTRDAS